MTDHEISFAETSGEDCPSPAALTKRWLLAGMIAWAAACGAYDSYAMYESESLRSNQVAAGDFLLNIPLVVMIVAWCRTDASEHSYRIGRVLFLLLVFLNALAVPVYFFKTRGLAGFRPLAKAIGFLALMVGAMLLGSIFEMRVNPG